MMLGIQVGAELKHTTPAGGVEVMTILISL